MNHVALFAFILRMGALGRTFLNGVGGQISRKQNFINVALRHGRKYQHSCVPYHTYAITVNVEPVLFHIIVIVLYREHSFISLAFPQAALRPDSL